ncbi:MAG: hypothetical protein ACJAUP_001314 [Cellvibrionaceae bacterium]|jgi:hypothetical protein
MPDTDFLWIPSLIGPVMAVMSLAVDGHKTSRSKIIARSYQKCVCIYVLKQPTDKRPKNELFGIYYYLIAWAKVNRS